MIILLCVILVCASSIACTHVMDSKTKKVSQLQRENAKFRSVVDEVELIARSNYELCPLMAQNVLHEVTQLHRNREVTGGEQS